MISGIGSNGYEGVLHFLQSAKSGAALSDDLVSHPGDSFGWSYFFKEMQSV